MLLAIQNSVMTNIKLYWDLDNNVPSSTTWQSRWWHWELWSCSWYACAATHAASASAAISSNVVMRLAALPDDVERSRMSRSCSRWDSRPWPQQTCNNKWCNSNCCNNKWWINNSCSNKWCNNKWCVNQWCNNILCNILLYNRDQICLRSEIRFYEADI